MVHKAERRMGKNATLGSLRTERERSGKARSGYVPVSRTYESNLRRVLRRKSQPTVGRPEAPSTAREQYADAHRAARRGVRSTRIKRTSVYDQSQSYYRGSRGSASGGFIEGSLGETATRARRGGAGDQNRRTQAIANVKNKRRGAAPRRHRQSDQGDAGQ